jgi:hypothetical protein
MKAHKTEKLCPMGLGDIRATVSKGKAAQMGNGALFKELKGARFQCRQPAFWGGVTWLGPSGRN